MNNSINLVKIIIILICFIQHCNFLFDEKELNEKILIQGYLVNNNYLFIWSNKEYLTFDISNINNPKKIDHFFPSHRIFDCFLHNNNFYISSSDNIYIYNLSDPTFPIQINNIPIKTYDCNFFSIQDNYLFVIDVNKQLNIFSIENLENIELVSTFKIPYDILTTFSAVVFEKEAIYLAVYHLYDENLNDHDAYAGLLTIDISDIHSIESNQFYMDINTYSNVCDNYYWYPYDKFVYHLFEFGFTENFIKYNSILFYENKRYFYTSEVIQRMGTIQILFNHIPVYSVNLSFSGSDDIYKLIGVKDDLLFLSTYDQEVIYFNIQNPNNIREIGRNRFNKAIPDRISEDLFIGTTNNNELWLFTFENNQFLLESKIILYE